MVAVPATVIYFTCYDQLTALLRSKLGENEPHIIVAGIQADVSNKFRIFSFWFLLKLALKCLFVENFKQSNGDGLFAS